MAASLLAAATPGAMAWLHHNTSGRGGSDTALAGTQVAYGGRVGEGCEVPSKRPGSGAR